MLTTADEIALERAIAPKSFSEFVEMAWPAVDSEEYMPNWHMDVVGDHLSACVGGEINRLLLNVPPGTSKSSAVGVFFPAWLWGPLGMPHVRYLGGSHDIDNAVRDNEKTGKLLTSDWFQARWPVNITRSGMKKVENDQGGMRQAASVEAFTGKRSHFVVWDDPLSAMAADSERRRKKANRIFSETLTTRLISPEKSVIIIIMQRLHAQDVSGHILARELGYHHVCLPMEFEPERRCYTVVKPSWMEAKPKKGRYHGPTQRWYLRGDVIPDNIVEDMENKPLQKVYSQDPRTKEGELLFEGRFPRHVVDRDKKAMGAYAAAGQLQQRPSPREGGLFKRGWFNTIAAAPQCVRWVRAWDLAATDSSDAAFTAGVLMGVTSPIPSEREFIIANVTRDQVSAGGAERLIRNTAGQDAAKYGYGLLGSLPKDPGAAGKAWAQALVRAAAGYNYRASPETGDKITRASPLSAQAEAGNVHIVSGPWNEDFLSELETFPNSEFKDQVDAASRAFMELTKPTSQALSGNQS